MNMTRAVSLAVICAGLAACQPKVPDSAAGVGFGDYEAYQQAQAEQARLAREAQLAGQAGSPTATGAPAATGAPTAAEIAAAGIGPAPVAPQGPVGAPLDATGGAIAAAPLPPATAPSGNPGISNEQSFDAVSARRSIDADAARLEQQRAARVEIAPQAVPQRPGGSTGSNIVAYALGTTNVPGQAIYNRVLGSDRRAQTACARFSSPDLAQMAFLEGGGPQRDRRGLDPDGDGFACEWDPRPFRLGVSQPSVPDEVEPEQ